MLLRYGGLMGFSVCVPMFALTPNVLRLLWLHYCPSGLLLSLISYVHSAGRIPARASNSDASHADRTRLTEHARPAVARTLSDSIGCPRRLRRYCTHKTTADGSFRVRLTVSRRTHDRRSRAILMLFTKTVLRVRS